MSQPNALEARLDRAKLPRHLAIIMDGNGRWAEARGLSRVEGHREGSNAVRTITRLARRLGIEALTLYAFSSQNWNRPAEEVAALMGLLREYLLSEREELLTNDIRLDAIGDLERLPAFVRAPLDALRAETAERRSMRLTLALSYGGREELLRACRSLIARGTQPTALDERTFEQALYTRDLPPLDLMIRTSGEHRISNFLLWQAAYAELYFTPLCWPDFGEEALLTALLDYQARERRFGLVPTPPPCAAPRPERAPESPIAKEPT